MDRKIKKFENKKKQNRKMKETKKKLREENDKKREAKIKEEEKREREEKINEFEVGSLWNNPMIKSARDAMTPEQIESYRKFGESMYGNMNFDNLEEYIDINVLSLIENIKAGLHPSYLKDEEKDLLKNKLGIKWYERYGFEEKDLNSYLS